MHGTHRQVTEEEFMSFRFAIARARNTEKRRSQLYMRILSVVEDMVGREVLINCCTIGKSVGADPSHVNQILNAHRPLARIICKHQRRHGRTLAQRREMQGPFVPCNI